MPKSEAFAIATQQMHSLGKSPKGYGTKEGRTEAKEKYDTPKDDVKTADPKTKTASRMSTFQWNVVVVDAFSDELVKIASFGQQALGMISKHPSGTMTLGGGALGAAAGAAAHGGIDPWTGQPKSRLAGALVGGGLGAAAGGLASGFMPKGQGTTNIAEYLRAKLPTQYMQAPLSSLMPTKVANLAAASGGLPMANPPANPVGLAEVKSTIPNKPLSGKTPKYTKVHSAPTLTPAASHQPVSEPPPVRR